MKPITVFTAQIGDQTDDLRPPLVTDRTARYVCFADRPVHVPPYEWIKVPSAENPRLASRSYKILADHPVLNGSGLTLWHDVSYQLTRDVQWVRQELLDHDLVALAHARVTRTLEVEAHRLAMYGYLTLEAAFARVQVYRTAGFKWKGPVTCGGLLARRQSSRMAAFNRRWWTEVQAWGGRDQASLDYVAWRSKIVVGHLEGQIKDNAYAQWREAAVPA